MKLTYLVADYGPETADQFHLLLTYPDGDFRAIGWLLSADADQPNGVCYWAPHMFLGKSGWANPRSLPKGTRRAIAARLREARTEIARCEPEFDAPFRTR